MQISTDTIYSTKPQCSSVIPPELAYLNELQTYIEKTGVAQLFKTSVLNHIKYLHETLPLHAIKFSDHTNSSNLEQNSQKPAVFFVGGVHGLERIGAQLVLSFLDHFIQRSTWDVSMQTLAKRVDIWFIPIVNPFGLKYHMRSNANHVDLMRNAPVESNNASFLVGGHRISKRLPWHRGESGVMEAENIALTKLILEESSYRNCNIVLDCHSGFGLKDRLWFPLASSNKPIRHLAEFQKVKNLLDRSYPNNDYQFEPQSLHYLTHGDIWDYAYLEACKKQQLLLPLTLEMGSWRWVKKNPLQISRFGMFNPIKSHRLQRVMRRHIALMDFLIRLADSYSRWQPEEQERDELQKQAIAQWYSS